MEFFFGQKLLERLDKIDTALTLLTERSGVIMASAQELYDMVTAMDAESTRLANAIQALIDRLAAGNLTAAEEDTLKAQMQAHLDKLRLLGNNPPPVTP